MATVDKAFAVLGALVEEGEASIETLAERLHSPRSSVYRLVLTLKRLGAVEAGSARGTYRLGLELLRLGSAVTARFDERQAALAAMERLHEATDETVFLLVPNGYEAVCVERIEGRWVRSMGLLLGGSLPLHIGASPRALLAFSPRSFWDEYIQNSPLVARTPQTPTTAIAIRDLLEDTRRTGCSISDGDVVTGMAAVGAPIFDYQGKLRAAISLSGPQLSILGDNQKASIDLIIKAASDVTDSWAATPSSAAGPKQFWDRGDGFANMPDGITTIASSQVPALCRVDQVCVLVDDIDRAVADYSSLFPATKWRGYRYGPDNVPELGYRGGPGEFSFWVVLSDCDPQIELIQSLNGPSIYTEWLDQHGLGFHHIGVFTKRLASDVQVLESQGLTVSQWGRGYGLDGDGGFAYFDTTERLTVVIELIEIPVCRRPPDHEWVIVR